MGLEKFQLIGWINKDNIKFFLFGFELGKIIFIYLNFGYVKLIIIVWWKGFVNVYNRMRWIVYNYIFII